MIGFEQFLKIQILTGYHQVAPGGAGVHRKFFFGDYVRNENLGKVTKFGYHTITGVDMPEPNVVPWVTLTPPQSE